jgi:hypothetical protein
MRHSVNRRNLIESFRLRENSRRNISDCFCFVRDRIVRNSLCFRSEFHRKSRLRSNIERFFVGFRFRRIERSFTRSIRTSFGS